MVKNLIRIKFELSSPLIISNGNNDNCDKDLIRDSLGNPFIPGSSIAGVIRSEYLKKYNIEDNNDLNPFGVANKKVTKKSRLTFYDAKITGDYYTSIRDGIGLDANKMQIRGAKYNYEVLSAGTNFITYIEECKSSNDEQVINRIADIFGYVSFGAKTTRGYGRIKVNSIDTISFNIDNDEYIDCFDMYDENNDKWNCYNINKNENTSFEVKLKLKLISPISIRKYSTDPNDSDFSQLTEYIDGKKYPVIPGTSWAGAFRHHMLKNVKDKKDLECIKYYFGLNNENGKEKIIKSKITFSESVISGSVEKQVTRNAIDRFSSGSLHSALYKETVYVGGNTELLIKIEQNKKEINRVVLNALSLCITDMNYGFLAVGGETSIGHGRFEVINYNDVIKQIRGDNYENK